MSWIATSLLVALATVAPQQQPNGWLGVYLKAEPQLPATIDEVIPGSPAEAAGLEEDDVIVSIDRRRMRTADAVRAAVSRRAVGDVIELGIERGGRSLKIKVTLARDPDAAKSKPSSGIAIPERGGAPAGESESPAPAGRQTPAGAKTEPTAPGAVAAAGAASASGPPVLGLELEQRPGGLVVVGVDPDGASARAGVPKGAVLQTMAGLTVGTLDDVASVLNALRGDTVRLVMLVGADQRIFDVRVRGGGNPAATPPAEPKEESKPAPANPDPDAKRFDLKRPTLVLFGTSWDEKSTLQRKVLDDPAVVYAAGRCDADILWADVALWSGELRRVKLDSVPSAALLRADGTPVDVLRGYQPAEAIVAHLERLHLLNMEAPTDPTKPSKDELGDPAALREAYTQLEKRVEGLEAVIADLRRKILELERKR